jgi:hypothetical protein
MAMLGTGAADADAVPELPPVKPTKVTLQLVLKNSYTKAMLGDYDHLSAEEVYDKAQKLKALHLEWQNIAEIANLEPFEGTEILYLQHNLIERIEGLDFMPKLQFLALQHNRIEVIENLCQLRELEFLDLSQNRISNLHVAELPQSLQILRLTGNPCTALPDYFEQLKSNLPELVYLDGKSLDTETEPNDISNVGDSTGIAPEVQLTSGERGLGAYYRKDEMREGMAASIEDQIQAYSTESLADVEGFDACVADAVKRSEGRRKNLEEQLSAVKQAMARAERAEPCVHESG